MEKAMRCAKREPGRSWEAIESELNALGMPSPASAVLSLHHSSPHSLWRFVLCGLINRRTCVPPVPCQRRCKVMACLKVRVKRQYEQGSCVLAVFCNHRLCCCPAASGGSTFAGMYPACWPLPLTRYGIQQARQTPVSSANTPEQQAPWRCAGWAGACLSMQDKTTGSVSPISCGPNGTPLPLRAYKLQFYPSHTVKTRP